MTEAEWNCCADPEKMLNWLRDSGTVSDRKVRLFGTACCRRIWRLLRDEYGTMAVEAAERYADGQLGPDQLAQASFRAYEVFDTADEDPFELRAYLAAEALGDPSQPCATDAAKCAASYAAQVTRTEREEERAQANLLRDILGNPFRDVTFDPTWRTPIVLSRAKLVYDERRLPAGTLVPALLAALADALQGAGCDKSEILTHLRSPARHVRGCWAVDLILDRN